MTEGIERQGARPWHTRPASEILRELGVDATAGLPAEEAARRLAKDGPNQIRSAHRISRSRILLRQFESSIVILLLIACVLSGILGDLRDVIAILAIVVLNAFQGFHHEYRAEKALVALQALAAPAVTVRRSGQIQTVQAVELVRGDIVSLAAGSMVPADCRIVEAASLRIQESMLTGESAAIDKSAAPIPEEGAALAERLNMLYAGTVAVQGRGTGVVVEIGRATELGKIAEMLESIKEDPTPLQKRLNVFSQKLGYAAVALIAIILIESLWRGVAWRMAMMIAISTAVAAVPEGLPAAITIVLAVGSQRMLNRKALLRRLAAIETLGAVSTICADKTGTLTQNRMTVTTVISASGQFAFPDPEGSERPELKLLLVAAACCSDVERGSNGEVLGEPTEVALVEAAARIGLSKEDLDNDLQRIDEEPFDSATRRMITVHRVSESARGWLPAPLPSEANNIVFAKGSFEAIADICSIDAISRGVFEKGVERLSSGGLRVLAVSWGATNRDMTLIGVVGLMDPPRPEARDALRVCREAGIRTVMITGDHPLTARRVAEDLGIADPKVYTGQQIAAATGAELDAITRVVDVCARVAPEHKVAIVESLQRQGEIVAMTGDGVNDAPALKRAHVGIAMGRMGTDVAREAADMVLQDDNFATIVAAVEEGRAIQDNLRKFLRFLLTCNAAEVGVMVAGPLLGMPAPLLPVQILWMNLVTDGLPALALGLEPPEPDVMKRPPAPQENLLNRAMATSILSVGAILTATSLAVGYWVWSTGNPAWQTILFTLLTFAQLAVALALRSERLHLHQQRPGSNRLMAATILITVGLHLGIVYWPVAQQWMSTSALSGAEMALCIVFSIAVLTALELQKLWRRRSA